VTARPSFLVAVDDGKVTPLPGGAPDAWSLSPDGRFVTYTTGEENARLVFVQAVAGGPSRQITDNPGRVRTPVWLPDGSGVAYGADDGIWVVPLRNGAVAGARRLALSTARATLRAFTDAGLFYTLQEDAEVINSGYQLPMDPATGQVTGAVEPLPGGIPEGSGGFLWSPDMRRTAFPFRGDPPSVAIRSGDSGTLTRFDVPGPGSLFRTLWSADGKEILVEYMKNGEGDAHPECAVQALDLATGRMRPFLPPMYGSGGVSFSADGRRMAYWNWENFGTARRMGSISVATPGQGDGHIVATAHGGPDGGMFSGASGGPKISPSGERVLFVRQDYADPFPKDGAGLWVVGSDGKGTRKLGTLTFIRGAVWGPTGRFIAYTGRPDTGTSPMVLRVVEVATGTTHTVPLGDLASGDVGLAGWSGDGRFLGLIASPYWEGYMARGRLEYWVVQGLEKGGR
jgi:Tol biopolymer transport system component